MAYLCEALETIALVVICWAIMDVLFGDLSRDE